MAAVHCDVIFHDVFFGAGTSDGVDVGVGCSDWCSLTGFSSWDVATVILVL